MSQWRFRFSISKKGGVSFRHKDTSALTRLWCRGCGHAFQRKLCQMHMVRLLRIADAGDQQLVFIVRRLAVGLDGKLCCFAAVVKDMVAHTQQQLPAPVGSAPKKFPANLYGRAGETVPSGNGNTTPCRGRRG